MAQRREPPDAFDYFPTPLWATRALFRYVLPALRTIAKQKPKSKPEPKVTRKSSQET